MRTPPSEPRTQDDAHGAVADRGAGGWSGSIAFGPDWLLYNGAIGPTDEHAHHADQITVSDGEVVEIDLDGRRVTGPQVIVDSDSRHAIRRGASVADVLFLEPDRRRTVVRPEIARLSPVTEISTWTQAHARAALIREAVRGARGRDDVGGDEAHQSVAAALAALPDLVAAGTVTVRDVASLVGLSPSRLSHVFVQDTGLPLRTYVRWARLQLAAERLSLGDSITVAAHTAGFADSAHFSRTFRSMFGLSPTDVFAHSLFLRPG